MAANDKRIRLEFYKNSGSPPFAGFGDSEGFAHVCQPLEVSAERGAIHEVPPAIESGDNIVLDEALW